MKKLLVALMLILPIAFSGTALAAKNNQVKTVVLPSDQTINGDYLVSGNTVEIAGTVNGDAYVASGQVRVTGTINGDLLVAGGSVEVSGTINGNVRAVGGTVLITGTVTRNLTIAAGSVELASSGKLVGNAVAVGGNMTIGGTVDGSIKAASGNFNLDGTVAGSVEVASSQVTLGSKAHIGHDLDYKSNNQAFIASGAGVDGATRQLTPATSSHPERPALALAKLISFLSSLVVGLIFLALFGGWLTKAAATIQAAPWRALGWGLVALIVTPFAIVLLLITVLGVPLGLILGAIYVVALYLSSFVAVVWVGDRINSAANLKLNLYFSFVLGLIVYWILRLIPILGGLTTLAAVLLGLGAIWLSLQTSLNRKPAKS